MENLDLPDMFYVLFIALASCLC